MFRRSDPVTVASMGVVDLTQPHDACLKCGRTTPLGVSLCDNDNPGHIKSPSTTQVHATILIGVIVGIGLLLLLFRFGSAGIGPFPSTLSATSTRADGGLDVAVTVTNSGTRPAGASCQILEQRRSGLPRLRLLYSAHPTGRDEDLPADDAAAPPGSGTTLTPVNLVVKCS